MLIGLKRLFYVYDNKQVTWFVEQPQARRVSVCIIFLGCGVVYAWKYLPFVVPTSLITPWKKIVRMLCM